MNDSRVWRPDGSCNPFLLEATNGAPAIGFVRPLMQFTIPSEQIGIVYRVALFNGVGNGKDFVRGEFFRGFNLPGVDTPVAGVKQAARLTGGVTRATEIQGPNGNITGFIVRRTQVADPCRVILDSGDWEFCLVNEGLNPVGIQVWTSLSGYTFPKYRHA